MNSFELRKKYLNFFKKRKHKEIPPASLVPENDSTTLFTSSGMQPIVPYLLGNTHPQGTRLVDSQPAFRTQDIEEIGDNRHTTFFEMLGNWSLGDYYKKEQLNWLWEFLTKELGLAKDRLCVSVFEGDKDIPQDVVSYQTWLKLGIPKDHIFFYGVKKNWWSRSGIPADMPIGEIGGPDSEVFYDFGEKWNLHKKSPWKAKECHPNCDCGRFLEIGNSVFIQYKKIEQDKLEELNQKNVDFGGGLERLLAAVNDMPDVFQTDLFIPLIRQIEKITNQKYREHPKEIQIIADHLKASVFLIKEGVYPSNKLQGYVLRRLLRRAALKMHFLQENSMRSLSELVEIVTQIYQGVYDFTPSEIENIKKIIFEEISKFENTIHSGLKLIDQMQRLSGKVAFDLYQTHGFPLELTIEIASEKGEKINQEEFNREFEKHKTLSRTSSAGIFKGGLANTEDKTIKLHTATHLLQASLRQILGNHVLQKGSNITSERLRFDFSHPQKLTEEELKQVENLVNTKIAADLPVNFSEMDKKEAIKSGALANFTQKYAEKVRVYSIGDFSKEICGGPHVVHTNELGKFHITKEESAGTGIRRIYGEIIS